MDSSQQVAVVPKDREALVAPQRHQRSVAEKRQIVEETLERTLSFPLRATATEEYRSCPLLMNCGFR